MLWHEHHNEGDEDAWVLPVQDAGFVTYGRILEIKFAAGGPTKTGVSAF
jgi:gentisate 1,2-dioxygenase